MEFTQKVFGLIFLITYVISIKYFRIFFVKLKWNLLKKFSDLFSRLIYFTFFSTFFSFLFKFFQHCILFYFFNFLQHFFFSKYSILPDLSNFIDFVQFCENKTRDFFFFSGKWYISSIIRGQRRNAQSSDSPIECSPSRPSNPGWSRPRRKWIKFRIIFIFWLFLQIDAKQSGNGWRIFYLWKIHSICVDISDQTTFWSFHG